MLDLSYSGGRINLSCEQNTGYPNGFDAPISSNNGVCEAAYSIAKKYFEILNQVVAPIQKVFVIKQLLQIINMPFIITEIAKKAFEFQSMDREKKIAAGLSIFNHLREIAQSAGTFVVALEQVKAIPAITTPWVKPFTAVISILSIATMTSKILACVKVTSFGKLLDQAEEEGKVDGKVTLESYKAMLRVIEEAQMKDRDFIYATFNTTEEKLGDALVDMQLKMKEKLSSDQPEEVEEGQKLVETIIYRLKGRVKQNLISSSFAITAAGVNIIGTALLLALPAIPVAWVFLGGGVLLDIGRIIHHKIGEYLFAQAIDLKRTKWEWLTC